MHNPIFTQKLQILKPRFFRVKFSNRGTKEKNIRKIIKLPRANYIFIPDDLSMLTMSLIESVDYV